MTDPSVIQAACECCATTDPSGAFWGGARFMQRGDCGHWAPLMRTIYAASSMVTQASYFFIGAVLLGKIKDRRSGVPERALHLQEQRVLTVAFGLFIGACGVGHVEGYLAFHWAAYHLFTLLHLITALVSVWAALIVYALRKQQLTIA